MKVLFTLFLFSLLAEPALAVKERALPWARRVVERNSELQQTSRALAASKLAVRKQKELATKTSTSPASKDRKISQKTNK